VARHELAAARFLATHKQELARMDLINRAEADAAAEEVRKLEATVEAAQAKLDALTLRDHAEQVRRAEADERAKRAAQNLARHVLREHPLLAPEISIRKTSRTWGLHQVIQEDPKVLGRCQREGCDRLSKVASNASASPKPGRSPRWATRRPISKRAIARAAALRLALPRARTLASNSPRFRTCTSLGALPSCRRSWKPLLTPELNRTV
jgi:hypothetical protein